MSPLSKRVKFFRTFWTFCIISMSLQQWKYSFFYCTVLYRCLTFNWDHGWNIWVCCHGELWVWETRYFSYLSSVSKKSDYEGLLPKQRLIHFYKWVQYFDRYLDIRLAPCHYHGKKLHTGSIIFKNTFWNLLTIRFLVRRIGEILWIN